MLLAAMLFVVVVIGCFAYTTYRNSSIERKFGLVAEGMSREEVVRLMGAPDNVRSGCRDAPTWLERPVPDKVCSEELRYNALLLPEFWTIGFDATGRAIAKYGYVSP
jgi:hypothetical protein